MKKFIPALMALLLATASQAQWLNQNAGFSNDTLGFYEMSLVSRSAAWAICYDGKLGLSSNRLVLDFTRTTDGGNTWMPGKMGTDTSLQFSNISAVNEQEAWVAMHKRFGITGGGLYHTIDGGLSWEQSSAGAIFDANSFPDFVHFRDGGKGIAVGDPNGGYFEIYTTMNGGRKWKRVPQSDLPARLPNEYGWISGFAALGNTLWFGTTAGRIYKTTNFGKDWTVHTVDGARNAVFEIAFNDDRLHGVAHVRSSSQTFLFATSDGGSTWTNLGQPANWKSSRITAVPGTNALVSTSVIRNNPGSAVSYDNGSTWTELENTAPKAVARFFDAGTGFAGGFFLTGPPLRGGIYKSQIAFQPAPKATRKAALARKVAPADAGTETVAVFPAPARDVLNVTLPMEWDRKHTVISLVSATGETVRTQNAEGVPTTQLPVSDLPAGFYWVRISNGRKTASRGVTIMH